MAFSKKAILNNYVNFLRNGIVDIQNNFSVTRQAAGYIAPGVRKKLVNALAYILISYLATYYIGGMIAAYLFNRVTGLTTQVTNFISNAINNNEVFSNFSNQWVTSLLTKLFNIVANPTPEQQVRLDAINEDTNEESRFARAVAFIDTYIGGEISRKVDPKIELTEFITGYTQYISPAFRKKVREEIEDKISNETFDGLHREQHSIVPLNGYFKRTLPKKLKCDQKNIIQYIEKLAKQKVSSQLMNNLLLLLLKLWWSSLPHSDRMNIYEHADEYEKIFKGQVNYKWAKQVIKDFFTPIHLIEYLFITVDYECIQKLRNKEED